MRKETFKRLTKPKDLDAWREKKRQEILDEARSRGGMGVNSNTGLFAQVLPNAVGDPFTDRTDFRKSVSAKIRKNKDNQEEEEEDEIPAFKAGGRIEKSDKGCFTPLVSLAVNDPYLDPGTRIRKLRQRHKVKPSLTQERPFTPGGVIHRKDDIKPVYNRTDSTMPKEKVKAMLEQVKEEQQERSAALRRRLKDSEGQQSIRNFLTAPTKRGTFGFGGLLFADSDEWKHTLEYVPQGDEKLPRRTVRREQSTHSGDSMANRPPFRSNVKTTGYFSSPQETYAMPRTKRRPSSAQPRNRREEIENSRAQKFGEFSDRATFRPSNPVPHDKYIGFPEYLHYHPTVPREKQMAKGRRERRPSTASGGSRSSAHEELPKWVPNSTSSSFFVRSIALNHRNLGWQ